MLQNSVIIKEATNKQELDTAANIFAEAFYNDPLFQMVFKDKDRLIKTKHFFSFLLNEKGLLKSKVLLVLYNNEIGGACSFSRPNDSQLIPINLNFLASTVKLITKIGLQPFFVLNCYLKIISKNKNNDSFYINFIGISENYRGIGLAKKLIDYIHKVVQEDKEYSQVSLDTENPKNIKYYERFGYQLVSEKKLQALTIHFMQKNI